jgi:cytochrome P450 family 9
MFGALSDQAQNFAKHFEQVAERNGKAVFELKDIFARFTADGIATCVIGFEGDCVRNKNSHVFHVVEDILHVFFGIKGSLRFLFSSTLPKLFSMLGLTIVPQTVTDFFNKITVDVIKERNLTGVSKPDMIQIFMEVKKGQFYDQDTKAADDIKKKNSSFDENDFAAQGFIFFAAGIETTCTLLMLTSYELAKNQEIQKTLIKEIDDVARSLNGQKITYEALQNMKFVDMVRF